MPELIPELFGYQAWADAQIVAAVKACPPAVEDARICQLLHHIVAVQLFFLEQPIDGDTVPPFAGIEARFAESARITPAAAIPVDHLLQIVLHSQHHRAQVMTRLRDLGGSPPIIDYILWKRKHA